MSDSALLVRPLVLGNKATGYKFEHPETETTLRLDLQGRWLSYRQNDAFYRRCMNGEVVSGCGEVSLKASERAALVKKIAGTLEQWIRCWRYDEQVLSVMLKAQSLRCEEYDQLAQLYSSVYPEDVPILPPDRYADLVVQPVMGCPNRACTFCAFYRNKPYKVMPADAFEQHLQGVKQLMGYKDGLFIGSANATALSQRRLTGYLHQIHSHFGTFKRDIAAFADPDFSAQRTPEQWQELAGMGLVRLVIGLETGWGELRGRLGKAADLSAVRQAVHYYKEAGISVGLTVLTGACQAHEQQNNLQFSGEFIHSLALDRNDIIYLSLLEDINADRKRGLQELQAMKQHFAVCTDARISPYQMQRFRYYC